MFLGKIIASSSVDAFNLFDKHEETIVPTTNSLFVFPAQCNFSGFKYPLELIAASQKGVFSEIKSELCINKQTLERSNPNNRSEWFCLLDAASYVGTNQLSNYNNYYWIRIN